MFVSSPVAWWEYGCQSHVKWRELGDPGSWSSSRVCGMDAANGTHSSTSSSLVPEFTAKEAIKYDASALCSHKVVGRIANSSMQTTHHVYSS